MEGETQGDSPMFHEGKLCSLFKRSDCISTDVMIVILYILGRICAIRPLNLQNVNHVSASWVGQSLLLLGQVVMAESELKIQRLGNEVAV